MFLAYILTADKPLRSPFSSPLGLQLTEDNTGWLEVYPKTADKPHQIAFQLTSGLAAYIIWVAANIQAATFGPAGLDSMPREQAQEGLVPGLHSYC